MLLLASFWSLFFKAPARRVLPAAVPGDTLAVFERARHGLYRSGEMVVPDRTGQYTLLIYQDRRGREYRYGAQVRPCDPTDQSGYVYLPATLLTVLARPRRPAIVVGDCHSLLERSDSGVQAVLAAEDSFLARLQAPAESWSERCTRWFRYTILDQSYLQLAYQDGREQIYRGVALGGKLGELVLVPEIEADTDNEGSPSAPSEGRLAEVKVIRYLTRYQQPVLEDLATFSAPAGSKRH